MMNLVESSDFDRLFSIAGYQHSHTHYAAKV